MGLLLAINKPSGITSHDVVNQIRQVTGEVRVGHAGTLDPLAEGVLVVAVGRSATRRLFYQEKSRKEYLATIRMDGLSSTLDAEGEIQLLKEVIIPSKARVRQVLREFQGEIWQIPPQYSALKIKGVAAYKLTRRKIAVDLPPRQVRIWSLDLLSYDWPYLDIGVETGPGVYVRSLARDVGDKLEVGGYLTALTRVKVGNYLISDSFSMQQFEHWWHGYNTWQDDTHNIWN